MTVKSVHSPFHGHAVKFGRKRATRAPKKSVKLAKYFAKAPVKLPVTPPACNYTAKAASALADIMGNDAYGDCVFAGMYHIIGVATGNAGALFHASREEVLADYSAVTGFNPDDPSTDNGAELSDEVDYGTNHGLADGSKILGSIVVDATNKQQVMTVLYLFEHLYMGVELPDAWVNPFPAESGFTWDVAGPPVPSNGHCIMACGYDANGVIVDTWGMLGHVTWAALAKYFAPVAGGELHVILTPDMIAKGQQKAPNGIDWSALVADFDSMGGHVPVPPAPAPTPPQPPPAPPQPAPPAVRTVPLQAAVDAVQAALKGAHPHDMISRESASSLALKALRRLASP